MCRKYLIHFLTVSLKYFFDFDYTTLTHSLIVVIVLMSLVKLSFMKAAAAVNNGLRTVKDDFKNDLAIIRARFNRDDTVTYAHDIKDNS